LYCRRLPTGRPFRVRRGCITPGTSRRLNLVLGGVIRERHNHLYTNNTAFSDEFKALWDAESQVRQLWNALEVFHQRLSEMATAQASALQAKSLQQLEGEV